jgi:hypothetical protein
MVEAWRLQKSELYAAVPTAMQVHVFVLYTSDKELEFTEISLLMRKGAQALAKALAASRKPAADEHPAPNGTTI